MFKIDPNIGEVLVTQKKMKIEKSSFVKNLNINFVLCI